MICATGVAKNRAYRTAAKGRLNQARRASAAKTMSGSRAMTVSSARAGPRGERLPCSNYVLSREHAKT